MFILYNAKVTFLGNLVTTNVIFPSLLEILLADRLRQFYVTEQFP